MTLATRINQGIEPDDDDGKLKLWFGFRDEEGRPSKVNPKQKQALEAYWSGKYQYLLLHGGVRSGKTAVAVQMAVQQMMKTPGISILFGHESISALQSSLLFHLNAQIPQHLFVKTEDGGFEREKISEKKTAAKRIFVKIPGYIDEQKGYTAVIDYRPLDPTKGLHLALGTEGGQYGLAVIDQIEMLGMDADVFNAILPRMSMAPHKIILTANPFPDCWFFRQFGLDGSEPMEGYWQLLLKPYDNFALSATYIKSIEDNLPEALKDRYIHGSYAPIDGLIISNQDFDYQTDVVDIVYPIPDDVQVWEFYDHGFSDPAACQWWMIDKNNVKTLIDSMRIHEANYDTIAKTCLTKREEILNNGRGENDPKPRFMGTLGDPNMLTKNQDTGRTPVQELSRYQHWNGDRFYVTLVATKGFKAQALEHHRIQILVGEFKDKKIKIGRRNTEWLAERQNWVYDKKTMLPASKRSRDSQGKTIHHFDHMAATKYGIAHYVHHIQKKKNEKAQSARDYQKRKQSRSSASPLDRFRRT